MARGKNPDGTPKTYSSDKRSRREARSRTSLPRDSAVPKAGEVVRGATPPPSLAGHAWYQDPAVLSRLEIVEKHRLAGYSALATSRMTGVEYTTVRDDFDRLSELWLARVARSQEQMRAEAMRKLDVVIAEGFETLRMDERYTQAVLFNMPVMVTCDGRQEHRPEDMLMTDPLGQRGAEYGTVFSCIHPHQFLKRVYHDEKGSASYRRVAGQVLQSINAAIMNQARLQGLIVQKTAITNAEGQDLPQALRAILLGEEVVVEEAPALPGETLDVGLA